MANKPLVSIVIPVYNSANTLAETLESCRAQSYSPMEIIVVDDGSSDDSVTIAESFGVRLIRQRNQGPGIARNTGILASQAEFIKFCDADDILYPEHLEKVMSVFQSSPKSLAVVYTRYQHVQADGYSPMQGKRDPEQYSGDAYCPILRSNSSAILTSATTVRRQALIDVGMFPNDENLRHSEDWDLFLRLAHDYEYAALPEILLNYRWHEANISNDAYAVAKGRLQVWQNSQHYPKTNTCLSLAELNKIIAGRYHVLAIEAWKLAQPKDARLAFLAANRLKPSLMRYFYYILSYILPYKIAKGLMR